MKRTVPLLVGIALMAALARSFSTDSKAVRAKAGGAPDLTWVKLSVALPASQVTFPPGNGADIANAQCLICHSAGMVLRQPALTQDQWAGEIDKMRTTFGAPLPADQVGALARYLNGINGRRSPRGSAAVDGQGS